MKIVNSLPCYSTIHLGDVIQHPMYGDMRVEFIQKVGDALESGYEITCALTQFNNNLESFDGLELIRIKYKRKTRLRIVK